MCGCLCISLSLSLFLSMCDSSFVFGCIFCFFLFLSCFLSLLFSLFLLAFLHPPSQALFLGFSLPLPTLFPPFSLRSLSLPPPSSSFYSPCSNTSSCLFPRGCGGWGGCPLPHGAHVPPAELLNPAWLSFSLLLSGSHRVLLATSGPMCTEASARTRGIKRHSTRPKPMERSGGPYFPEPHSRDVLKHDLCWKHINCVVSSQGHLPTGSACFCRNPLFSPEETW